MQLKNNRREQKTLNRKLEILRNAAAAFRRRGFDGTRMEEISDAMHMTKGSLYYYFKNKEDLLYFCQDHSLNRLLTVGDRILRMPLRADEKLYLLILAQMRCMLDELYGSAAHIEFHAIAPPRLKKIIDKRDRYEGIVRRTIESGTKSGLFQSGNVKMVSLAILGAINWSIKWYTPEGEASVDEIARTFADYLVRGILAPGIRMRIPSVKYSERIVA